jgi:alpha-glucosidase
MSWLDGPAEVLAFTRPGGFTCVLNLSDEAVPLPDGELILASSAVRNGLLAPDTAAWVRTLDSAV